MNKAKLTFIGAGNMASSIIGGLVSMDYPPHLITATDPWQPSLDKLAADCGINTSADNGAAVAEADIVLLAVKPQVLKEVCCDLRPHLANRPLLISIAAGIDSRSLDRWLGNDLAIVRCMPNTPALVQAGASGLYANARTSESQRQRADEILSAVGVVRWLDREDQLDAVTAVSGSGPAYFFLFMEAMIEAAAEQGLDRDTATQLTLQTALGAAKLALGSNVDVAELRRRVTSPGGTTEQALESFEKDGLRPVVARAMLACAERSREMSGEMGG